MKAGWLEARERAGRLLYVERGTFDEVAPDGAGLPLTTPLLRVNSTYLKAWPVADRDSRPIQPPADAQLLVLVPDGSTVDEKRLAADVMAGVKRQLFLRSKRPPIGAGPLPTRVEPPGPGSVLVLNPEMLEPPTPLWIGVALRNRRGGERTVARPPMHTDQTGSERRMP